MNKFSYLIRKISTGGASIFIAKFSLIVIGFATELILINALSQSERGEVFYIRTIAELLGTLLLIGLGNSAIHFGKRLSETCKLFTIYLYAITFITIFFCILIYFINPINSINYINCLLLSAITAVYFYIQRIFVATNDYAYHNLASIAPKTLFLVLAIFIFYHKIEISSNTILALIIISHATLIPLIYKIWKKARPIELNSKDQNIKNFFWSSITFGFGTLMPNIGSAIKGRFEVFLVEYFFGDAILGIYAVSKSFLAPFSVVTSTVSLLMLKKFSADTSIGLSGKILPIFPISFGVVTSGFLTINTLVYLRIIPESYNDVGILFLIGGLGFSFLTASTFIQSYLFSKGKSSQVTLSLLVSSAPLVLLAFTNINDIFALVSIIQTTYILQFIFNFAQYKNDQKNT